MSIFNTSTQSNLTGKLIAEHQASLNISDQTLAEAIGYGRGSVVAMIKAGALRLPATKVPVLAAVFEIDVAELLVTVMSETNPELMKLIEQVWPRDLTPEEGRLIKACRQIAAGRKVAPIIFGESGHQSVIALVTV